MLATASRRSRRRDIQPVSHLFSSFFSSTFFVVVHCAKKLAFEKPVIRRELIRYLHPIASCLNSGFITFYRSHTHFPCLLSFVFPRRHRAFRRNVSSDSLTVSILYILPRIGIGRAIPRSCSWSYSVSLFSILTISFFPLSFWPPFSLVVSIDPFRKRYLWSLSVSVCFILSGWLSLSVFIFLFVFPSAYLSVSPFISFR